MVVWMNFLVVVVVKQKDTSAVVVLDIVVYNKKTKQ